MIRKECTATFEAQFTTYKLGGPRAETSEEFGVVLRKKVSDLS